MRSARTGIPPAGPVVMLALAALGAAGCAQGESSPAGPPPAKDASHARSPGHERMLALLEEVRDESNKTNLFIGTAKRDELKAKIAGLKPEAPPVLRSALELDLATEEMRLGRPEEAVRLGEDAIARLSKVGGRVPRDVVREAIFALGVAYLRVGEVENCCARHTGESCILPIQGSGIHTSRRGSTKAIESLSGLLDEMPAASPLALRSKWLLNIASMTLGEYPDGVPERHRIDPKVFASDEEFPKFQNIAREVGLVEFSPAGGMIADDFDGDGRLDLLVSTMDTGTSLRLYNLGEDGRFIDRSDAAGLAGIFGGLNLVHADYDNDGDLDVLVLRGAWWGEQGRHPRSLLRNEGGGRFTDVTFDAGLADFRFPTQTGAFGDVDNDGDLDLYIGSESHPSQSFPCQCFRNEGNGRFTEVAAQAGVTNLSYTKGVVFGDVDEDGFADLYVSNIGGPNRLYRNNHDWTFTDIAESAGVTKPLDAFACWFWDFDNDGALDIWCGAYGGPSAPSDVANVAASYLGMPHRGELGSLYRGDGKGKFEDVAVAMGVDLHLLPMGANFGDLDNDGFLDFQLATGYPAYEGLMPNVMYRNRGGTSFADITSSGGFGHLQKGHGVAFADVDEDGDQDVIVKMGGGYPGDAYGMSLFENPGFGNHWIKVRLVGTRSNRCAIGARMRIDVVEDGRPRSIHRVVGSGGSFGGNPFRQEVGVGQAGKIATLEVFWPASGERQTFSDLAVDQSIEITEGREGFRKVEPRPVLFHR